LLSCHSTLYQTTNLTTSLEEIVAKNDIHNNDDKQSIHSNDDVQVVPSRISVIPFAVSLPTSTLQGFDEPAPKGDPVALVGDNGVVGTILLLNNAVQVWVGWGKVRLGSSPLQPKGVIPSGMLNLVGVVNLSC
jgi:hypothetical protein